MQVQWHSFSGTFINTIFTIDQVLLAEHWQNGIPPEETLISEKHWCFNNQHTKSIRHQGCLLSSSPQELSNARFCLG